MLTFFCFLQNIQWMHNCSRKRKIIRSTKRWNKKRRYAPAPRLCSSSSLVCRKKCAVPIRLLWAVVLIKLEAHLSWIISFVTILFPASSYTLVHARFNNLHILFEYNSNGTKTKAFHKWYNSVRLLFVSRSQSYALLQLLFRPMRRICNLEPLKIICWSFKWMNEIEMKKNRAHLRN